MKDFVATEFPAVPGETVTIPLGLLSQGLEGDILNLAVEGIPSSWVSASAAAASLSPGQLRILAASQAAPGQVAAADCSLTIAVFSQFSGELRP